jgi:hypothetical protein
LSSKTFLISLLLLIGTNAFAQSSNGLVPAEVFPLEKGLTARFNFIGLLDAYDENFSVGGEYRFAEHWSAGSDVAYIFTSEYLSQSKSSHGVIIRPFIRFYPENGRNGFFEMGLHYKHVDYRITDWIGKNIVNGIPTYEKYETFSFIKNAYEVNFKAGTAANLSRNKKWRLEFYGGLGVRFKKQHSQNGSYTRHRNLFTSIYGPGYSTIVIPMGMRLVHDLK